MRACVILVVVAAVCLGVASAQTFTSVAVGGDLAQTNALLAPPNRVVNVPLGQVSLATVRGSDLLGGPGPGFVTAMPAACNDCECSNFINPADASITLQRNAYLAAAQARLTPLQLAINGGTATLRTFVINQLWTDNESTFGPVTNYATRGLLCFFPTNAAGIVGTPSVATSLNVWIVVRFDCSAPANCEVTFRQNVADRATGITRYISPEQALVFRAQTDECIIGSTCSCFDDATTIGCCSGKLYDRTSYKCCANHIIVLVDDCCPCTSNT
jgi:hypothetical protein